MREGSHWRTSQIIEIIGRLNWLVGQEMSWYLEKQIRLNGPFDIISTTYSFSKPAPATTLVNTQLSAGFVLSND